MLQKWKRNEEFVTEREVIYGICNGKGKEKGIVIQNFLETIPFFCKKNPCEIK